MMILIKIAWRNIWRSKKRSFIIMATVSIGLWLGIFLISFYNGMIEQRVESAITTELSHLQIHHPKFTHDYDIQYLVPKGHTLLNRLNKNPNIKVAAGRVVIKGMIASASGSTGITLNGVMPNEEHQLTKLGDKITAGRYFKPDKANEVIISERLAKKLKLQLNKKAIVTFQNKDGDLASIAFKIIALYKTVNGPYDDSNIFANIRGVDLPAGIPNELNEIAVLLQSNDLLSQSEAELKQQFPTVEILNWMEISPEIGLTVSVGDQMVYIFMGIILLALAFGIVNTMMMAVLERTKEIGMLLALGMNKIKIFGMILLETFFLVMAGCPGGIFLALVTIAISQQTGITLKALEKVSSSFGYSPVIYPSLQLRQFGIIMILVVITALFSALLPARRAVKLKPAESIKK